MLFILILLNALLLFDNFLVRKKIKIFENKIDVFMSPKGSED